LKRQRSVTSIIRVFLPPAIGLLLFAAAIYAVVLPRTRGIVLFQQEQAVEELTSVVIQTVDAYHELWRSGTLTEQEAQAQALSAVRRIRYGAGDQEYFWINDQRPYLLMHPYRPDLEGTDVSDYRDSGGTRVFGEMVEAVRDTGSGYVEYLWQWHDDPGLVVPKRSYVKLYEPWGWIVGTGIYLQGARKMVDRLTGSVTVAAAAALLAMVLTAGFQILTRYRLAWLTEQADAGRAVAERRYDDLVDTMLEGFVVLDSHQRIQYANDAFCTMVGREPSQVIGTEYRSLLADGQRAVFERQMDRRRSGGSSRYEITFQQPDGTLMHGLIAGRPHVTRDGAFQGSFGVVTDITDLKRYEEELLHSVHDKEILLAEVHHRVKNNLQVISSMLHLQCEAIDDPRVGDLLDGSLRRIESMGLVHSFLYAASRFDAVPFHDYVGDLLSMLSISYDAAARGVAVENRSEEITVSLQRAVPLALIVTELTTNAFKHAFPNGGTGSIQVRFERLTEERVLRLTVADNGVGMPATSAPADSGARASLGMTLVDALAAQLEATVTVVSDHGTRAVVEIPEAESHQASFRAG